MTGYSSHNLFLLIGSLLFILFSAPAICAQSTQSVDEKARINAQSAYIDGLAAFENENYQQALELLKAAYVKLPDHAGVNFSLADTYLRVGDIANAEYYGKQAVKLNPKNQWYRLKLARIYRDQGKNNAAVAELQDALQYNPRNSNLLRELAQSYSDLGDLQKANDIYNKLLYLGGENLTIRLQKLDHFNSMGMQDSAIAELKKIRNLDPDNLSTLRVLSNQLKEMGKVDEAQKVLENALRINNRDTKTLIMLSDIYIRKTQWDSLDTLLRAAVSNPSISQDEKITLGQYLYSKYRSNTNNSDLQHVTGSVLQKLMEVAPESGRVQGLAGEFFANTQQPNLALKALERTNNLSPTNDSAWKQRLQILLTEGRIKEAVSVGKEAAKEIPQDPVILYLLGNAQLSNQQPKQAIKNLTEASKLPVRRSLKGRILAALGNAHAALDKWESAYQYYDESLEINPENAGVLNNYAYYLSLQNKALKRAEQMAQKALELDPQNASYLDTMGWVYYQQGAYKKAEKYIHDALQTGQAIAEVMEHLGDVLDKLDRPDEARKWWQKALDKDSSRTHLKNKLSSDGE